MIMGKDPLILGIQPSSRNGDVLELSYDKKTLVMGI